MNSALTRTLPLAFAVAALSNRAAAQTIPSYIVRAENTLNISRADETIALRWSDVRARLAGATPAQIRVRDVASGREIPAQAVDNDGDGTTDELIFQGSFSPAEIKRFTIEAASPLPSAKPAPTRVYATHTDPRDDVAWESDRIAYRIYGQGLWKVDSLLSSGIDVWVKRVRDPIVDKWYAKGHDLYHRDTGEGADFYDVGQSLGAGGTGIWKNDQLYRAYNFKSWKILANGPVRAIFELQYQPWDASGLRVSETKRIAIDAGQNLNHVVSVFRAETAVTDIPWVTGLVKRKGVVGSESKAQPWAWLSMWGPVNPKDGGHGDLGTAVMVPRDIITDWKETDDHYLAIARAKSGQPVSYWIGAGWTDSGDFRDVRDWWSYLDQWSSRLSAPIKITVEEAAR
ncbi:MAG: pectinesterase [Gemmatimonadetes bacterium]|nr:pectinesterase [Gemmatimonadota bacterium]